MKEKNNHNGSPLESCPECGNSFDDIEFDFQSCFSCGCVEVETKQIRAVYKYDGQGRKIQIPDFNYLDLEGEHKKIRKGGNNRKKNKRKR